MKKLSVSIFALAILFTVGSAFTNFTFTGYRVFAVEELVQPTTQNDLSWYESSAIPFVDDASEFDLDVLADPTPQPGDEVCEASSLICLAQFKIDSDIQDMTYQNNAGVEIRQGTLVQ